MKTTLVVLLVLTAAAAFGQSAPVITSQAQMIAVPEHPLHASPHAMAQEQPIVGGTSDTYTYAHGERPLWEFGPTSQEPSLGEVARAYRRQKMMAPRAEFVFEKQGS